MPGKPIPLPLHLLQVPCSSFTEATNIANDHYSEVDRFTEARPDEKASKDGDGNGPAKEWAEQSGTQRVA